MRKILSYMLIIVFCLFIGSLTYEKSSSQAGTIPVVSKMTVNGQIAKADQGYIIRGKVPAEIFTILNPDPDILDEFVKRNKNVNIEVRIVSGDNVEIEKIDGKEYRKIGPGQ